MQVFKLYFKIIKGNLRTLLIYLGVFVALSVMMSSFNVGGVESSFSGSKASIAIFNNDDGSAISEGLIEYLSHSSSIKNIKNDKNAARDALFFREVVYIIEIPKGFGEKFVRGENVTLGKMGIPQSTEGIFIDNKINEYLNAIRIFSKFSNAPEGEMQEMDFVNIQKLAVKSANEILVDQTNVEVKNFGTKNSLSQMIVYYFNYMSYSLLALLILGISTIMLVFNSKEVKMRMDSSPLTLKSYNSQLFGATLVFVVGIWLFLLVIGAIMFSKTFFELSTLFMAINSLAFALTGLCLSVLIGTLLKKKEPQQAIANVITLGSCFIGGVFVPLDFLSDTVVKIASFTPTYWYVKNNLLVGSLINFGGENMKPYLTNLAILIGFGITFITIQLVISKYRHENN